MPTVAQLAAEPWWRQETVPPALASLAGRLRAHFRLTSGAVGIRGDEHHLAGYHRSREWVLRSRYCTNRGYSVTETGGNRAGGDPRWVCGLDLTLTHGILIVVCRRLDAAVRAGRLEKVTEWYGNLGGDQRVDGYDNIRNAAATSDPSHLWHLHLSLDRGRANDNHDDIFAILTGQETSMADDYGRYGRPAHGVADRTTPVMIADLWAQDLLGFSPYDGRTPSRRTAQLNQIGADVAALRAAAAADEIRDMAILAAVEALAHAGGVDAAPIVAAVTAVRDEARQRFAELQAALTEAEADRQALQARLAAALNPQPDHHQEEEQP